MSKDIDQALSRLYRTPDAPEGFETGWRAAVKREELLQMNPKPSRFSLKRTLVPVAAALVLAVGSLWAGTLNDSVPAPAQEPMLMRSKSSASTEAEYGMADSVSANTMAAGASEILEGRKIIRTADLSLSTQSFDEALASVEQAAAQAGGYVESLYQHGEAGSRRVTLSLRVPSQQLDAFLSGAETMGRVVSRSESISDMTTQYSDNQARLHTLYQKRDRLNELMLKAESVSDLIEIESAIADTQYEIDLYETQQRSIDRQVDMSMVSVTIVEETPGDAAQADLPLGQRLVSALRASVEGIGHFLRNMLVFIVMALPVAIPLGLAVVIVRLIRRRKEGK